MPAVWLSILWVFAATATAMLPMRYQYPPGFVLFFCAPVLVAVIWMQHGGILALLALAAFVSMFRKPLYHLWRRHMRGEK